MHNRAQATFSLFAVILIILSACSRQAYEHMNAPSRDAWQHPKAVIEALDIAPAAQIADLGAGGGYFTFPLAQAVGPQGRVYAVDIDDVGLTMIQREAKQRGVSNIVPILAAPDDPGLPPASVDLIFTCNTYHHLRSRVAYFRSLARALRPDGRVAIIDYKDEGWLAALLGHATSKDVVQHEMEAAGYRLLQDHEMLPKQHFQVFRVNKP
jgi:arsenite methyltransferase